MNVGQAMIADVTTCSPQDSLRVAAERLRTSDCGVLPVVDARARVLGMLTDRDICMAACTHDQRLSALSVSIAMSSPAVVCRGEDPLVLAERRMRYRRVRRLPVVDGRGVLVGIISIDDLAREAVRSGTTLDGRAILLTLVSTCHYPQLEPGLARAGG